jgi:hypothetical protein
MMQLYEVKKDFSVIKKGDLVSIESEECYAGKDYITAKIMYMAEENVMWDIKLIGKCISIPKDSIKPISQQDARLTLLIGKFAGGKKDGTDMP